ncbi:DUF202 domain-containing protein [Actinosynnema mirum]|uniref:DUF202 domain-containing protein n=1 Tax=Actinosynnema mirum (strain ATCC 29888 / DSM 43827 / JCM 3225 / NBRC 14064 / NCIMB 13271 / NRRL B-12336 / IMRU 3971 / 101) TaxID=446462 RepID=C6WRY2_ACTMD|nr:DUF202 domain-containing protein [Actinosynnema mirum]ACU36974.1 hypothetical protein Amir_3057 [Actinosynnema mirum DSM 43827]
MAERARFDPGLQPERTLLAWRRTVLAVAATALVSLRVLPPVLGAWSLAVGPVFLVVCAALWALAERRSARAYRALLAHEHPELPGGGALLGLTALVVAVALVALVWTLPAHS